jgi:hypothetical protein
MDPRFQFVVWRSAAWAGPVFLAALGIGWAAIAGFLPAPHESWSATETQQWFVDHAVRIRIGLVIYLLFCALYIPWSIAISRVLRRIEGRLGVLSQMEYAGGIGTTIVAMAAGVMWMAAAFRAGERSPQDVQLLMDLGWFWFNLTFGVTAVQMVAVGIAGLLDRRAKPLYPKWLSWASFAFSGTFLPLLLLPFVTNGAFAWNGLFNYYAALGGAFAWDVAISCSTFAAITKIQAEESETARDLTSVPD